MSTENNHFKLLAVLLLIQPSMQLAFTAAKGCFWVTLVSTWFPRSFFIAGLLPKSCLRQYIATVYATLTLFQGRIVLVQFDFFAYLTRRHSVLWCRSVVKILISTGACSSPEESPSYTAASYNLNNQAIF